MKLVEILVGMPKAVEWKGKPFHTAIFKEPIATASAKLGSLNIDGDKQADPRFHGGPFKAVYGYDASSYPAWREHLARPDLALGSFGENLCITNFDERDLFVGDVLQIGTCELKVIQPRLPCQKLAVRLDDIAILKTFLGFEKPGVYFSVQKTGVLEKGAPVKILHRSNSSISIFELFEIYAKKKLTAKRRQELLRSEHLIEDWKEKARKTGESE